MSAMRKVKFAVLESSLLARKGAARPAAADWTEQESEAQRTDAEPHVELIGGGYDGNLAALITRLHPVSERVAEAPVGATCAVPLAIVARPEPTAVATEETDTPPAPAAEGARPMAEVVREWTERVVRDRRIAANLHPRGLNRDQAARYVGLSVSCFKRLVAEGLLPPALHFGRRRVWDLRALDDALDRMSGLNAAAQPVVRDA
jgi:predicted DNA-binding transcriptional regulator AlpA